MFRSILSPLLILLLLAAAAAPLAAQDEKPLYKMGLVLNNNKRNRDLDSDVLNAATRAFFDSKRFTMVERAQLDAVFTEKDLQGFLGKGNKELSDVLGLDMLGLVAYTVESKSMGGVNRTIFTLEVRLVDVKTGQILGSITSERPDYLTPPATPRDAGRGLFQSVREAFPPFGYIVKIDGENVVVDLGSEAGVQEKDVLEIVREGEKIIHPVTGEVLPSEMVVIGELKVLSTSAQLSQCKLKSEGLMGRGGKKALGQEFNGKPVRLKEQNNSLKKWLGKGRDVLNSVRR